MRYLLMSLLCVASFFAQAQQPDSAKINTKITARQFANFSSEYNLLQNELKSLELQRLELEKKLQEYDSSLLAMSNAIKKWEQQADAAGGPAGGNSQNQLMNATKQMQETQMSFNLQYLQLQSQMQQEDRSYSLISNIMKTKHDTVKNSISNIR